MTLLQLGLDIYTCILTIDFFSLKYKDLLIIIDIGWYQSVKYHVKQFFTLLRHTRMVSILLPIGSLFSIIIQQCINHCIHTLVSTLFSPLMVHKEELHSFWRSKRNFVYTTHTITHNIVYIEAYLTHYDTDTIQRQPISILLNQQLRYNSHT